MKEILIFTIECAVMFLMVCLLLRRKDNEYKQYFAPRVRFINPTNILAALFVLASCYFIQTGNVFYDSINFSIIILFLGVSMIDRMYFLIPDRFQVVGLILALVWLTCTKDREIVILHVAISLMAMLSLTVIGKLYEKIRKSEAMGFGDVKLIGWVSLILGQEILLALMFAFFLQIIFTLIHSRKNEDSKQSFPFAPALCCSFGIFFLLLNQYQSIF